MNRHRFDDLTRLLISRPSRRHLVAGFAGGIFASPTTRFFQAVSAKKKRKRKKKKKPCRPESPAATCDGRCGTVQNNCQQAIDCLPCPSGQICLSNGICATYCGPSGSTCPGQCGCPSWPTTEGAILCGAPIPTCSAVPQVCEGTLDCPLGSICQMTPCGPGGTLEGRCRPLCNE